MKKLLLGLVVGFMVALPASVFAWNQKQSAQPIKGVDCSTEDGQEYDCNATVYVFDDSGNKCYVVSGGIGSTQDNPNVAISCLKD